MLRGLRVLLTVVPGPVEDILIVFQGPRPVFPEAVWGTGPGLSDPHPGTSPSPGEPVVPTAGFTRLG